jgi:hypothetical protein
VSIEDTDPDLAGRLVDPFLWAGSVLDRREDPVTQLAPAAPATSTARLALLGAAIAGGAVAVSLGVYGNVHNPSGQKIFSLGFSSMIEMKAWLATGAFALAMFQLLTALSMFGRIRVPRTMPSWLPFAHRWSGTAAFVLTLPVAYHCLWSLGFQDTDARVLIHSLLGCAFYGAFTTKLLSLRIANLPKWSLPIIGGLLVATLTGLWFTASLWYFRTK